METFLVIMLNISIYWKKRLQYSTTFNYQDPFSDPMSSCAFKKII